MDFSALALFGALGCTYPAMNALQYVAKYVSQLAQGQLCAIGYIRSDNELRLTKHSTTQLVSAMHFVVDAILQLRNVQTVRAAHGVRYFGKVHNVKRSILMWWQQDIEQYHLIESDAAGDFSTKSIVGDAWKNTKYLQFLSTTEGIDLANAIEELQDIDATSDVSGGADASGRTDISDPDRLSTIDEEQDEYLAGNSAAGTPGGQTAPVICPAWCDADMWDTLERQQQTFLQHIHRHDEMSIEETRPIPIEAAPRNRLLSITVEDTYAIYNAFAADTSQYGNPDVDENGNTYHEIEFPDNTAKLITDSPPPPGHTVRLRVYEAVKRAVIERSDDILTQDELAKHRTLVLAGSREELISWIKHKCFVRKLRRLARNILDVRWVAKWKFVKADSVAKGHAKDHYSCKNRRQS
jgi:hypothetical protein